LKHASKITLNHRLLLLQSSVPPPPPLEVPVLVTGMLSRYRYGDKHERRNPCQWSIQPTFNSTNCLNSPTSVVEEGSNPSFPSSHFSFTDTNPHIQIAFSLLQLARFQISKQGIVICYSLSSGYIFFILVSLLFLFLTGLYSVIYHFFALSF
jgi:hypothetical protein